MARQSTERDEEHVKGLAIAHYILAGLSALSALPAVLFAQGFSSMLDEMSGGLPSIVDAYPGQGGPHAPGAPELAEDFTGELLEMAQGLGAAASTLMIVTVVLSLLTAAGFWWIGNKLRKHERWSLCYLTGWFECLAFPFGTVVGIFTILVLARPGVKRLFGLD